MQFDTLIQGGTVVTAADTYAADIGISGGRITAIAQQLPRETARQVLSAQGLYVMPGGIDPHTHLQGGFADDLTTGTAAAVAGGITAVGTFANPSGGENAVQAMDRSLAEVAELAIGKPNAPRAWIIASIVGLTTGAPTVQRIQRVALQSTPCAFGGRSFWFRCPA